MSTKKLEEYKELYSQYLNLNIVLHNYNLTFLQTRSTNIARRCKKTMKEMKYLLHYMEKLAEEVRKERLGLWREEIASRKIIKPDGSVKLRNPPKKKEIKNG